MPLRIYHISTKTFSRNNNTRLTPDALRKLDAVPQQGFQSWHQTSHNFERVPLGLDTARTAPEKMSAEDRQKIEEFGREADKVAEAARNGKGMGSGRR